jgi:YHS domain-containing protein
LVGGSAVLTVTPAGTTNYSLVGLPGAYSLLGGNATMTLTPAQVEVTARGGDGGYHVHRRKYVAVYKGKEYWFDTPAQAQQFLKDSEAAAQDVKTLLDTVVDTEDDDMEAIFLLME